MSDGDCGMGLITDRYELKERLTRPAPIGRVRATAVQAGKYLRKVRTHHQAIRRPQAVGSPANP
jgi:hypothetical protein